MQTDPNALLGRVLGGRYELVRILGRGARATVFEAVNIDLGRRVAIKVLSDILDPRAAARLRREAFSLAALNHPHVVQVIDLFEGQGDDPPWIVMDRVDGLPLATVLLSEGALPPERAVRIALQILSALSAAHAAGIVHRDVQPDHVFLVQTAASSDFVKLFSFGLAKSVDDRASATATLTTFQGPPAPPMDIYGVGTCLHAMLGPRDATLDRIVARALEGEPSRRFASAQAMQDELEAWLAQKGEPREPPAAPDGPPLRRPEAPMGTSDGARSYRSFFLFAGVTFVLAGAIAVALFVRTAQRKEPATTAAIDAAPSASVAEVTDSADAGELTIADVAPPVASTPASGGVPPKGQPPGSPNSRLRGLELAPPEASWIDPAAWKSWSAKVKGPLLACFRLAPSRFDSDRAIFTLEVTATGAASARAPRMFPLEPGSVLQNFPLDECVEKAARGSTLVPLDATAHTAVISVRVLR